MTRLIALAAALLAAPAWAADPAAYAAPGPASAVPPLAGPLVAGRPMRLGLQVEERQGGVPPATWRAFLRRRSAQEGTTDEAACFAEAQRAITTASRGGLREPEVTGPLLAVLGEDATVALVVPGAGVGPARLAGLARLPQAPEHMAPDKLGQRLFLASAASLFALDVTSLRTGPEVRLEVQVADLLWDQVGEQLAVAVEGAVELRDAGLALRHRLPLPANAAPRLALDPAGRLLFALAGAELWVLHAATLAPLRRVSLPEAPQDAVLAWLAEPRLVLAVSGTAVLALEAESGRTVTLLRLPAPARTLLPIGGPHAVALLADRTAHVLDLAAGSVRGPLPAGLQAVEAAAAEGTLYLRPEDAPRLALFSLAALRDRWSGTPGMATAVMGAAPFGAARLPLLAPGGGQMLVASPEERRVYVHHGLGMAAPSGASPSMGSRPQGLAVLQRVPVRTAARRAELTAATPPPGRWRLVIVVAGQGRAICTDFESLAA